MQDETREQLSALVDDELPRDQLRFLVQRLGHDSEALEQLRRYYLIHEALHSNLVVPDERLTSRVARSIAEEPELPRRASAALGRSILRPAAGVAVAAGVAIATLALWPQSAQRNGVEGDVPVVAEAQNSTELRLAETGAEDGNQQWSRLDPQVQKRLNGYLVNHSEYSSNGRLGGVVSFSRIASHDGAE